MSKHTPKAKEPKKPYTIKYLSLKLLNADIVLVLCDWDILLESAAEALDEEHQADLKRMYEKHGTDRHGIATCFHFDGGGSLISARHDATFSTLVHEAVHAAHHLLKKRSTPLSEDTEEVYAYLVEHIVNGLTT